MSMFTDVVAGMKVGDAMAKEIADLRRQLDEVTAERDLARRELSIADTHRKDLLRTLNVANATIDRLRSKQGC